MKDTVIDVLPSTTPFNYMYLAFPEPEEMLTHLQPFS